MVKVWFSGRPRILCLVYATTHDWSHSPSRYRSEELENTGGGRGLGQCYSKMFGLKFKKGDEVLNALIRIDSRLKLLRSIYALSILALISSQRSRSLFSFTCIFQIACVYPDTISGRRLTVRLRVLFTMSPFSVQVFCVCTTSQSRSRSFANPRELKNIRGGRNLDISRMSGSNFKLQESMYQRR
ncbi:hypothetical protein BDN72DRAFT_305128 [Pluteus cervinus]|uniref:Uncharacterized protein n=1 Tax=Pluteus cervinus TaxID=181527 RepID=A0ACD3B3K9_9AGAR|nr:hypothetical protein BDN72DRAFT_305128 [Pluteus cervinus]